jgi:inosine-uridine nucleoside N-ribohydrolase
MARRSSPSRDARSCARSARTPARPPPTGYEANQPTGMPKTAPVHDALCVAALADPSLIATKFVNAVIETRGEYTIGRTVVDHEKRTKRAPNCHVAFAAERDKFFALLKNTFAASR